MSKILLNLASQTAVMKLRTRTREAKAALATTLTATRATETTKMITQRLTMKMQTVATAIKTPTEHF
jgi:hypothetical protein